MDEAVIRKVKEIVVRRKISENEGGEKTLEQIEEKFEQRFQEMNAKMEDKINSLESKIDLLLTKL